MWDNIGILLFLLPAFYKLYFHLYLRHDELNSEFITINYNCFELSYTNYTSKKMRLVLGFSNIFKHRIDKRPTSIFHYDN